MQPDKRHKYLIDAVVSEYAVPPVKDMLILGRDTPIGCVAMRRALELLTVEPYEHIELEDDVISDILVRKRILRRIPQQDLMDFVMDGIKPLLGPGEILHVALNIQVHLRASQQ